MMASEAGMPPYELGGGLSAWSCGLREVKMEGKRSHWASTISCFPAWMSSVAISRTAFTSSARVALGGRVSPQVGRRGQSALKLALSSVEMKGAQAWGRK